MKISIKKGVATIGLLASLSTGVVVFATVTDVGGGTWDYGYNIGQAYSNYYHSYNYHGAQVVDRNNDKNYSKVNAGHGAWAKASISIAWIGGQGSFYYSTNGY